MVFMERHQMQNLRDLQMRRPLEFTSDEERSIYTAALAAHLDSAETQVAASTRHGDRWGHVSD